MDAVTVLKDSIGLWIVGSALCLTVLNTILLGLMFRILNSASKETRNFQEIASNARAIALALQTKLSSIDSKEFLERHEELWAGVERAEQLKNELSVFVEHGDKVVEKLDRLIKGIGRER